MVYTKDLSKIECLEGNFESRICQIRGNLSNGNPARSYDWASGRMVRRAKFLEKFSKKRCRDLMADT